MQEKTIKVVKTDGKVLEYRAPIKAHQVLSDFAGHALSDTLPVVRHLQPEAGLTGGGLYYLLPFPVPPPAGEQKKRVRFACPKEEEKGEESGVVRIKLVITKKELELMLRKGAFSVDDHILSQLQKKENTDNQDCKVDEDDDGDGNRSSKGWKPMLESIPEVN